MNTIEYTIAFDAERCVACYGCVVACKTWRERPLGLSCRRLDKIWQKEDTMPRLRHASVACRHCVDPDCMKVCFTGAISKNKDGIVLVDEEKCVACQACKSACSFDVPQFPEKGKMTKCDMCFGRYDMATEQPPCVASCPTHALTLKKVSIEEKEKAEHSLAALLASGAEW